MPLHVPHSARRIRAARSWCLLPVLALAFGAIGASAQTLASKAKESGCVDKPKVVVGATYRCTTASGASAYFNVPEGNGDRVPPSRRRAAPVRQRRQRRRARLRRPGFRASMRRRRKAATTSPQGAAGRARHRGEAARSKAGRRTRTAHPPALADEQKEPQRYAERIAQAAPVGAAARAQHRSAAPRARAARANPTLRRRFRRRESGAAVAFAIGAEVATRLAWRFPASPSAQSGTRLDNGPRIVRPAGVRLDRESVPRARAPRDRGADARRRPYRALRESRRGEPVRAVAGDARRARRSLRCSPMPPR